MSPQDAASPFGPALKADFPFGSYTNLNHGSFGAVPKPVTAKLHEYQALATSRPDPFMRYNYVPLTNLARKALADMLNTPLESTVLVANASEAVNTIFRNLTWPSPSPSPSPSSSDATEREDVIIHFNTIYSACRRTIQYVADYFGGRVSVHEIPLNYPLEDDAVVSLFRDAVHKIRAEGKNPRIALFDVVSSLPAVCVPWKELVLACKELGVLSLVDGAQGIGMVPLDLGAADPDFFTSNCHKWLFVPHGAAVLYVAPRNLHLLPTTLATSARYIPGASGTERPVDNFALSFEFVGTKDYSPWYCVPDALAYRRNVLGGEEAIMEYIRRLNKTGSKLVAQALGTEVLDNQAGSLTDCAMAMIALPIWVGEAGAGAKQDEVVIPEGDRDLALDWMARILFGDYDTFIPPFALNGRLWVRISAQVYLDTKDYEFAAETLRHLCKRVARKEYLELKDLE